MRSFVVDTHALVWFIGQDRRLSYEAIISSSLIPTVW